MEDNPETQFDGLLMTLIQQGGGIANFFDAIFGFLQRKTDYFANDSKHLFFLIYSLLLNIFRGSKKLR